MDTPRNSNVSSGRPWPGRALRAIVQLEASSKLALVCVVFGWFFTNTLVVNLGSLQHGIQFFDMGAVIADPTRLFFGIDTSMQRVLFGMVCLVCVFAPITPQLSANRLSWLASSAPLALILVCGLILYSRTSGEFFAHPGDAKSVSGTLIHFANDLARRGSGVVSRHISIGAGGYLAFLGSVVLAVQGIRRFRRSVIPPR